MESVLSQPKKLKEMMEAGMRGEAQEGGLSEEELRDMLDEVNAKPKQSPVEGKGGRYSLRGEGGSGERPRTSEGEKKSAAKKGRGRGKGKGKEGDKEKGREEEVDADMEGVLVEKEEESQELEAVTLEQKKAFLGGEGEDPRSAFPADEMEVDELVGGDHHADQGDISVSQTRSASDDKTTEVALQDLRRYCEDQFASFAAVLAPIQNRMERLERTVSVKVAPMGAGSPPHKKTRGERPPSTDSNWSVLEEGKKKEVGVDKIDPEKVALFVKSNPKYPSLAVVRNEKMKALQRAMGLEPRTVGVKTSDWNKEGIYTALVVAYGGE